MPKYYCEYCDIYLTHSSPAGRRQHASGRRHINQKSDYFEFAACGSDLLREQGFQAPSFLDQSVALRALQIVASTPPGEFATLHPGNCTKQREGRPPPRGGHHQHHAHGGGGGGRGGGPPSGGMMMMPGGGPPPHAMHPGFHRPPPPFFPPHAGGPPPPSLLMRGAPGPGPGGPVPPMGGNAISQHQSGHLPLQGAAGTNTGTGGPPPPHNGGTGPGFRGPPPPANIPPRC